MDTDMEFVEALDAPVAVDAGTTTRVFGLADTVDMDELEDAPDEPGAVDAGPILCFNAAELRLAIYTVCQAPHSKMRCTVRVQERAGEAGRACARSVLDVRDGNREVGAPGVKALVGALAQGSASKQRRPEEEVKSRSSTEAAAARDARGRQSGQSGAAGLDRDDKANRGSKKQKFKPPLGEDGEKPGYLRELLESDDGEERSFEEVRLMRYVYTPVLRVDPAPEQLAPAQPTGTIEIGQHPPGSASQTLRQRIAMQSCGSSETHGAVVSPSRETTPLESAGGPSKGQSGAKGGLSGEGGEGGKPLQATPSRLI